MNENTNVRLSMDPRASQLPFSLKVDEMEKESSSESSGDEFVNRARKSSLTKAVNNKKS